MGYTVFLSHSTKDRDLIADMAAYLQAKGIKAYVAEWDMAPGKDLPGKVATEIKRSDCVVAILTKSGARSEWVKQEYACAIGAGKLVIPFAEKGVKVKGFLEAKECIRFDRTDPDSMKSAMERLRDHLDRLHIEKKEGFKRALWIVGGLVLLSMLFPDEEKQKPQRNSTFAI